MSARPKPISGLTRRLIQDGLIDLEAAEKCSVEASKARHPLVSYLVKENIISAEAIAAAAASEFGTAIIDLDAILKIKSEVSGGTQLNHAMRQANVFPSMVVQMVSIGEESGALDAMLDKSATYYEEMVDNAVDGLTSMIEPIIMAFLGIVVGGMMIAMYLPIFQMGGAMS